MTTEPNAAVAEPEVKVATPTNAQAPEPKVTPEAPAKKAPGVPDIPFGDAGLELRGFADAWYVAGILLKADAVPHIGQKGNRKQPSQSAVTTMILAGSEVGLGAVASVQNIAIINQRPVIYGPIKLGIVIGSPLFHHAAHKEWFEGEYGKDNYTAYVQLCRVGGESKVATFSIADAKRAQLWGKGTWAGYWPDMLKYRAYGRVLNSTFPDLLGGIPTRDEAAEIDRLMAQWDLESPEEKRETVNRVDALAAKLELTNPAADKTTPAPAAPVAPEKTQPEPTAPAPEPAAPDSTGTLLKIAKELKGLKTEVERIGIRRQYHFKSVDGLAGRSPEDLTDILIAIADAGKET